MGPCRNVPARRVQVDEAWAFTCAKAKLACFVYPDDAPDHFAPAPSG